MFYPDGLFIYNLFVCKDKTDVLGKNGFKSDYYNVTWHYEKEITLLGYTTLYVYEFWSRVVTFTGIR